MGKISVTQVFIACHDSTTSGLSRLSQSLQIIGDVVLDRLESLRSVVDHLPRHVAERGQHSIDVEVFFIGPARKRQLLRL